MHSCELWNRHDHSLLGRFAARRLAGSVDFPSSLRRRLANPSAHADAELQLRQPEYCTFRSIRSLHISWNIDASKPSDLVGPAANFEFLYQCLTSVDSPDIVSFGFQEMVSSIVAAGGRAAADDRTQIDLENKGLTASAWSFARLAPRFADLVPLWQRRCFSAKRSQSRSSPMESRRATAFGTTSWFRLCASRCRPIRPTRSFTSGTWSGYVLLPSFLAGADQLCSSSPASSSRTSSETPFATSLSSRSRRA